MRREDVQFLRDAAIAVVLAIAVILGAEHLRIELVARGWVYTNGGGP